ncbi:hypothetical protein GQ55_8G227100 [Panicum hallii var. hallii]|uniref:Uncharacterized protein n=1 Tax=Panicum hallii var. hallii TaxID=1504633 RepID=A0A2T7CQ64_9POAL|nr:hypothetical protein GQ55_8G227100 [Panicum hallii var. hallii]
MKITVHSSKPVKPAYGPAEAPAPAAGAVLPLTVFDEVNHDEYVPGVFAFHPPAPPAAALEAGLARMLGEYREWAGRLVTLDAASGRRAIALNDAGARLVEAAADVPLAAAVMPLRVGPEAVRLHPSCEDGGGAAVEELMLLQVTRFPCGSFAVGYTMHHSVADGYATCSCLLAWGQAVRGAAFDPVPVHDRASLFVPRDPPLVEFEHRGAEFKPRAEKKEALDVDDDEVVVQTVHFSREFIARLKSEASPPAGERHRPYSAAQCVVAHLWRCVTVARGLGPHEVTRLHIAVNGRGRMPVPEGYTGNAVLWARPAATARELLGAPLRRAAGLVSRAVARVDGRYFRSFVDFASSGAVEREGLVRTAVSPELVARTNLEVDSVLGIPFYDLDFGTGRPFVFAPTYSTPQPVEGAAFLVPAPPGHGGVVAHVPLFRRNVDAFTSCCHSLAPPVPGARL